MKNKLGIIIVFLLIVFFNLEVSSAESAKGCLGAKNIKEKAAAENNTSFINFNFNNKGENQNENGSGGNGFRTKNYDKLAKTGGALLIAGSVIIGLAVPTAVFVEYLYFANVALFKTFALLIIVDLLAALFIFVGVIAGVFLLASPLFIPGLYLYLKYRNIRKGDPFLEFDKKKLSLGIRFKINDKRSSI